MGMEPEDFADEAHEVWPENWPAWELFVTVSTQWRTSAGGVTGLDYGPLFTLMDRLQLAGQQWFDMFDDIRTLEGAALETIRSRDPA